MQKGRGGFPSGAWSLERGNPFTSRVPIDGRLFCELLVEVYTDHKTSLGAWDHFSKKAHFSSQKKEFLLLVASRRFLGKGRVFKWILVRVAVVIVKRLQD